ncbi:MAG: hypothetical protein NTW62_01795 [Candidatus Nomurabacteria bacterium]|nr:hypothetical protein [Candidatus Nomurabacteria bacterium]
MNSIELTKSFRGNLAENGFSEKKVTLEKDSMSIDFYKENINHTEFLNLIINFYKENKFECLRNDGFRLIYEKKLLIIKIVFIPYFMTDKYGTYTFLKNRGGAILKIKYI